MLGPSSGHCATLTIPITWLQLFSLKIGKCSSHIGFSVAFFLLRVKFSRFPGPQRTIQHWRPHSGAFALAVSSAGNCFCLVLLHGSPHLSGDALSGYVMEQCLGTRTPADTALLLGGWFFSPLDGPIANIYYGLFNLFWILFHISSRTLSLFIYIQCYIPNTYHIAGTQ